MNFGYPFTPFQTPMQEEMMEMNYMNQQQPMQQIMKPCQMMPQSSCNQVVQKQFVEEMPYYVDYHTHIVNNVVRKHIQIPVYSQSQETVYFDEWQMGCGCNR